MDEAKYNELPNRKKVFVLLEAWAEYILNDIPKQKDFVLFVKSLITYQLYGTQPTELNGQLGRIFEMWKPIMDKMLSDKRQFTSPINGKNRKNISEKNEKFSENISESENCNIYENQCFNVENGNLNGNLNFYNNKNKNKNKDKDGNNREIYISANKKFAPPSRDEVRQFFELNSLNGDYDAFFDFYESNGWKVGKNQMKDWKASARNWSRRQSEFDRGESQKQSQRKSIHGRIESLDEIYEAVKIGRSMANDS